jgi:hypothetical protein
VWNAANQICSKRLVPFLPEFVEALERFGHLLIDSETKSKLFAMSPATVDRLLRGQRGSKKKSVSTTKSGALLKSKIKIRTFADWDDAAPGFFEADLVAHCGDSGEGSFLNTLVLTDIATGWIEFFPMIRKGESDVISALNQIRSCMPLPLSGLDTDNGSEFINYGLLQFCEEQKITFTRSRAYKKNDQAHVEQKNGNVVRRIVGYNRFDGLDAGNALLELYQALRLYVNFFQPSVKLLTKDRTGSRWQKQYDRAQTPYQRILSSKQVTLHTKEKLRAQYKTLDPVALYDEIGKRQTALLRHSWIGSMKDPEEVGAPIPVPILSRPQIEEAANEILSKSLNVTPPKRKHKRSADKPRVPHTWRTMPDPFVGLNDDIELMLRLDPKQTAKQLFQALQEKHPGKFDQAQYRTLQRRVKTWRKNFAPVDLKVSLYSNPEVQLEIDRLVLRALERSSLVGANSNESTPMS